MLHTIAQLKDGVSGLLTGTNLNNVTNLYGAFQRAARTVSQRASIPEASGRYKFMLYDGVIDYPTADTIFGGSLVDMRPQGDSRSAWDYVYKKPVEQFDRTKHLLPNGYQVAFEYDEGTPIMRVVSPKPTQRVILDNMDVTTGWVAGGNASGLALDTTVYYQQPAALRFNLAAAGSAGYLEKTATFAQDLTDYAGVGVAFLALMLPTGGSTAVTSVALRLGNDSTHYYGVTATTAFFGSFEDGEYMLIPFDLATQTPVGTVTPSQVDYMRLTVNYNGTALTNMRMGGLWISLPSPTEMLFQSSAIFLSAATGSVPLQAITLDTDTVILNDSAYNIYEHECAAAVALQNGGTLASGVVADLNQTLNGVRSRNGAIIQYGLYDLYRAENPSQVIQTVGNWYDDD